jgi:hypothetical protein
MKKKFIQVSKKFASENNLQAPPNSLIFKLKTNLFEDFKNMSSLTAKNFQTKWSTQIYHTGKHYQGLIEVEKKSDLIIEVEKFSRLINSQKIGEVYTEVKPIINSEDRENIYLNFKENLKKCSMFNNNTHLAGIVRCKLYYSKEGLKNEGCLRHDDYGRMIEKLEDHHDCFEVIEIQGQRDGQVSEDTLELIRLEKMIEIIRDNKLIGNKLISVRTKSPYIAGKVLDKGANIISDPTGGKFDHNMISVVAQNHTPFILNFNDGIPSNKKFYEAFTKNLENTLNYCIKKGMLNSNIALDLNLNFLKQNQIEELENNIKDFRKKFDNSIISLLPESEQNRKFFLNNLDLIRYPNLKKISQTYNYIKSMDISPNVGYIPSQVTIPKKMSVQDIPSYKFTLLKEKEVLLKNLFDLSKVKQMDQLSSLIQKNENKLEE